MKQTIWVLVSRICPLVIQSLLAHYIMMSLHIKMPLLCTSSSCHKDSINTCVNSLWHVLSIVLTHCGLVLHMPSVILVNTGSGNGLLPDNTKPLPEPILTDPRWGLVAFTWGKFHRKCTRPNISMKIINSRLQPHPTVDNEIINWCQVMGIYHWTAQDILVMSPKMANLRLQPHIPWTNKFAGRM